MLDINHMFYSEHYYNLGYTAAFQALTQEPGPPTMQAEITQAPAGRMAKRRLRTRQQILDATEFLLLQRGYNETSAEAIAELADLGRSTFYNHFDNKEEAVLAALIVHYRRYGEDAYVSLEEHRDRALSMLKTSIRLFTAMAEDPLTRQLADRPGVLVRAVEDSQEDLMARDLSEGMAQGRFKFTAGLDSLMIALTWAYIGLLISAINNDSIQASCLDWCRILLLNLGVDPAEIEALVAAAQVLKSDSDT
jgi:AcrR family transcriptional regulator